MGLESMPLSRIKAYLRIQSNLFSGFQLILRQMFNKEILVGKIYGLNAVDT